MRRLLILLGVPGLLCVAAWATKPSAEKTEAHLNRVLRAHVDSQDLSEQDDVIGTAALIGCKLRPDDCVRLLRRGIEMTIEDRTLYTRIDVTGFDRDAQCYGVFGKFLCPGGKGITGITG